jgi:hypothetical protein
MQVTVLILLLPPLKGYCVANANLPSAWPRRRTSRFSPHLQAFF